MIGAILALFLVVPATVMAAGFGGQNAGAAASPGQHLCNGQNCTHAADGTGSAFQARHQYGMDTDNKLAGHGTGHGAGTGQGTMDQKHTRTMQRLHTGNCTACRNAPAAA